VSDLDSLRFDSLKGYETIFINGSRKYSISLVVDMLPDNVDSTWGPSNKIRLAAKFILKPYDERIVSNFGCSGVKLGDFFGDDCFDHRFKICLQIKL